MHDIEKVSGRTKEGRKRDGTNELKRKKTQNKNKTTRKILNRLVYCKYPYLFCLFQCVCLHFLQYRLHWPLFHHFLIVFIFRFLFFFFASFQFGWSKLIRNFHNYFQISFPFLLRWELPGDAWFDVSNVIPGDSDRWIGANSICSGHRHSAEWPNPLQLLDALSKYPIQLLLLINDKLSFDSIAWNYASHRKNNDENPSQ